MVQIQLRFRRSSRSPVPLPSKLVAVCVLASKNVPKTTNEGTGSGFMRLARMKISGAAAVYHCITRVVAGQFLLSDTEKEKLKDMLWDHAEFGGMSSPEKSLAFVVFGRVHEIVHSLIGASLCDGGHNARPGFNDDLMNHGIDRPFASRSGFEIVAPLGSGTLDAVLHDRGVVFVDILTGDTQV